MQSRGEALRQRSLVIDAAASGVQAAARALSVICRHTAGLGNEFAPPSFSGPPSATLVEATQQLTELTEQDARFASFLRRGAKNQTGQPPIDLAGAKEDIAIEKNLGDVRPNVPADHAIGVNEVSLQVDASAASYSQVEIAQAIRSLAVEHKTALIRVARVYARRTVYGHEDLIQEAFMRVLDGRREWPRGLHVVPFLCGVMRSIAWDWRVESHDAVEVEPTGSEEGHAIARLDAQKVIELFKDDPIAQKILIGMVDGARGEDLRELSGLTRTEYESKRTKIRRHLEKVPL
jgi:DNA-directed RNA polymerase specialized sigma24 family protein